MSIDAVRYIRFKVMSRVLGSSMLYQACCIFCVNGLDIFATGRDAGYICLRPW